MTEPKKYSIENLKEALDLAFTIGETVVLAKKNDGKIDYADFPLLMNVFPKVGPAFSDANLILAEIKDLDVEEAKELQDFVLEKFGKIIDKEQLVEQVKLGLEAMVAIYKFVLTFTK